MKINFKKIKIQYEKDNYLYRLILLKHNKVYDVRRDNNIIYIYYDINFNIDEILNIKGNKERLLLYIINH